MSEKSCCPFCNAPICRAKLENVKEGEEWIALDADPDLGVYLFTPKNQLATVLPEQTRGRLVLARHEPRCEFIRSTALKQQIADLKERLAQAEKTVKRLMDEGAKPDDQEPKKQPAGGREATSVPGCPRNMCLHRLNQHDERGICKVQGCLCSVDL